MISIRMLLGLCLFLLAVGVGLLASFHNVRNSKGPKEKAYVLRVCVIFWVLILSLLALVYYLPAPYRYIATFAYFVACPVFVYKTSKTHQLIRIIEEREREAQG